MRVLHVLNGLNPSGMERMLCSAVREFSARGIETAVLGQGDHHPFLREMRQAGLNVRIVPQLRSREGRRRFKHVLGEFRPDIVHIHTEGFFAPTVLIIRSQSPASRIVRTVHNVFQNVGGARASRQLQAFVADRFVDAFVAPSPDVAENEASYARRCRVIYNWVDPRYFDIGQRRSCEPEPNAAVIVGNSSRIKNQVVALRAVQQSGISLYMYGDESHASPEERRLLDELAMTGQLLHRGVGDPAEGLARGSLFLMPSLHEGMPVALAEAMVAGLRCLVSDAPGLRWSHKSERVRVVQGGASVWADAIMASGSDASVVKNGEELDARSPDFSVTRGVDEYTDVYRSVGRRS